MYYRVMQTRVKYVGSIHILYASYTLHYCTTVHVGCKLFYEGLKTISQMFFWLFYFLHLCLSEACTIFNFGQFLCGMNENHGMNNQLPLRLRLWRCCFLRFSCDNLKVILLFCKFFGQKETLTLLMNVSQTEATNEFNVRYD